MYTMKGFLGLSNTKSSQDLSSSLDLGRPLIRVTNSLIGYLGDFGGQVVTVRNLSELSLNNNKSTTTPLCPLPPCRTPLCGYSAGVSNSFSFFFNAHYLCTTCRPLWLNSSNYNIMFHIRQHAPHLLAAKVADGGSGMSSSFMFNSVLLSLVNFNPQVPISIQTIPITTSLTHLTKTCAFPSGENSACSTRIINAFDPFRGENGEYINRRFPDQTRRINILYLELQM
jgi:hypothetical protein